MRISDNVVSMIIAVFRTLNARKRHRSQNTYNFSTFSTHETFYSQTKLYTYITAANIYLMTYQLYIQLAL